MTNGNDQWKKAMKMTYETDKLKWLMKITNENINLKMTNENNKWKWRIQINMLMTCLKLPCD